MTHVRTFFWKSIFSIEPMEPLLTVSLVFCTAHWNNLTSELKNSPLAITYLTFFTPIIPIFDHLLFDFVFLSHIMGGQFEGI